MPYRPLKRNLHNSATPSAGTDQTVVDVMRLEELPMSA
jgi:hypothetical protein